MSRYIKRFEWIVKDNTIIKIESINAYLSNQISEDTKIDITEGSIILCNTEESDMQYDEISNTLILVDNTDYWVSYDEDSSVIDTAILDNMLSKRLDGKGLLNSGNYVGILDLGRLEFSVVIKSKKVNYERDFQFLRESISDFCSDLLTRSSSYYSEHFHKSEEYAGEKINYSELAYLREMLSPDKFPSWIDYFLMHAEHKYIPETTLKPLCEIDELDADEYLSARTKKEVFKTNKICLRAGQIGYAPVECETTEYEITYDTAENRFIKFFILFIYNYLNEIMSKINENNSKLKSEVSTMQEIVEEKLENTFWRKISNIEDIPFNSQVLQKKYPYNLIFQMYTEFTLKSEVDLGEIDRKYIAGQKDAPMLYQYWVFIMLFKYLSKKYEDKYVTSDWISYDDKNLTFTLAEGRKCYAKFDLGNNKELQLLYNKTYDNNHVIWSGRSYSHELKPDISLELFKDDDLVSIIHFDAKYRKPFNGADVPDDINKMHAYKDGIIGTIGSYAICLADSPVNYYEDERGWDSGIFPGVGACPLNLNPDTIDAEMNYIYSIVDKFVQIEINNNTNRFSHKRLQSYYSLMRKMMLIEE